MTGASSTSAPKLAEDIKAHLKSTETTTSLTLDLLRAILGLEDGQVDPRQQVKTTVAAAKTSKTAALKITGAPRRPTEKRAATFEINESVAPAITAVPAKDRRKLATEVINTSLKTLSATAKSRIEETDQAKQEKPPKASRRAQQPLKECSQNRQTRPPRSKASTQDQTGLETMVQCASTALQCLRRKDESTDDLSPFDLGTENAALVVVDKCIALNIKIHAEIELRKIHDQYWKRRKPYTPSADNKKEGRSLTRCLYALEEDDAALCRFATSFQSQCLRLLILKGGQSVDADLTEALDPETIGSPAWTILASHKLNFVNAEVCGSQLRTLSLAILKLYTLAAGGTAGNANHVQALRLSFIALHIKCLSWKYLHHTPDLPKELWTTLTRSLKCYQARATKRDDYLAAQYWQSLQKALEAQGLDSNLPKELVGLVEAVMSSDARQPSHGVEVELTDPALCNTGSRLLSSLRNAVRVLSDDTSSSQGRLEVFESVLNCFAEKRSIRQIEFLDVLLACARLRKLILSKVGRLEKDVKGKTADALEVDVHVGAVRVIYGLLDFFLRSVKSSHAPPAKGLLLTLAKTADAVLEMEQYSIVRDANLFAESRTALLRSAELSTIVQTKPDELVELSVLSFFQGLPARIAQHCWSRYRLLTERRQPTPARLEALQDSLSILKGLPLEAQKLGNITVKYEEAARVFLETEAAPQARQHLMMAIECQIEQGCLSSAVEHSLSNASQHWWDDKTSMAYAFGRNLADYVRIEQDMQSGPNWCYDSDQLPLIHRAILIEMQLLSVLSRTTRPLKHVQLRSSIQAVLIHSSEPAHRNYRLRFISHLFRLLERDKLLPVHDVLDYEQMNLIMAEDSGTKAFLESTEAVLHATVRIQWSFAFGAVNEDSLEKLVRNFGAALCGDNEDELLTRIHDLGICMPQAKAVADYAGVLGRPDLQLDALRSLSQLQNLDKLKDPAKQALCLSQIGLLQSQADDTIAAGKSFAQADKLLQGSDAESVAKATASLNYAEYLLNISNLDHCSTILKLANIEIENFEQNPSKMPPRARFEKESNISRYALLASRLAFAQGILLDAFTGARQAAKLSTALWITIEKHLPSSTENTREPIDSSLQLVTRGLSNLSLTCQPEQKRNASGAMYWAQISLHRATLQHMAFLAVHAGLYQDALFYCRQASQIASQTAGRSYCMLVDSDLARIHAGAAKVQTATGLLAMLMVSLPSQAASDEQCTIMLNLSEASWLLGDNEQSHALIERTRVFQRQLKRQIVTEEGLPTTVTPRKKKPAKSAPARQPKLPPKSCTTAKQSQKPAAKSSSTLTLHQQALMGRLEAMHYRLASFVEAIDVTASEQSPRSDLSSLIAKALAYLQKSLAILSEDPANASLGETALAFPVRCRATRKSGQLSLLLDEGVQSPLKVNVSSKRAGSSPASTENEGYKLLTEAYAGLRSIDGSRMATLPSSMVHLMQKALSQISLLSTALSQPLIYSPMSVVLQCSTSKDTAMCRERIAVAAESKTVSDYFPTAGSLEDLGDLVNTLPMTWSIVSLGLSHDQNELILSKISAGVSPFLMRVPLTRPGLESTEAHDFDLDFAKQELINIIQAADANTHDPRGQGHKQTRKAWYGEREALDERLECLLKNIENVWLGGFKGLLAPNRVDSDLLARFGQSLSQALNKHLPSRQKASKSQAKIELHARVLELFVTIKMEETAEYEDAITDLLYFVVDMLQFNGEPNAIDEIDFDELLVDVLDALRSYHQAIGVSSQKQQTILILDKELHGFPWESLPCLRGQAVYRMPSLGAIKERLDILRSQSAEAQNLTISVASGAYMLNPSSDLTSTQETFSTTFVHQLSHFTAITNRVPTESEFKSCLTNNAIFLYFGHGSGGQYIRGRTIRALRTTGHDCAVSWLMGCSSLKMTECGIYEPYGMPWHYINGGSHAVVGTLWDVTDRDVDRFAMKALCEWGLLEETEDTQKPFASKKGKGNAKPRDFVREKKKDVAIGEAVAVGREACLLRYLNGAAPVVYGIPVSLE